MVPYKGSFVRTFTSKDLFELYEMRIIIESEVVGRAAERRTPAQLKELAELLDSTQQVLADNTSYPHEHDFHLALLSTVDNNMLVGHVRDLMAQSQVARSHSAHDPKRAQSVYAEYVLILEAIGNGNPEKAQALMHTHLNYSLESAHQAFSGSKDNWPTTASDSSSLTAGPETGSIDE
ncbi:MAG: GntR family transcriptional regulator [Ferrimicrobium sp.]